MRKAVLLGSFLVALSSSSAALAQVETSPSDEPAPSPPASAPPAPASPPPPSAKDATPPAPSARSEVPAQADRPADGAASGTASDHRFELGVRIGMLLPGEMSPSNWLHHDTLTAPLFAVDPQWLLNRYVELGAYLMVAPLTIDRGARTTYHSEVDGAFASGGFAMKGRLEINEAVLLRGGVNLGLNSVAFSGKSNGSTVEASGTGFDAGLVADGVWRLSRTFGVSAQLGFVSQVLGSAKVKGPPTAETGGKTDRDFRFSPIVFLTVGPELFL